MNRQGDNLLHTSSNKQLVAALEKFGVEFVVIGGLAVAWYCDSRLADDLDIFVNPSHENAKRICMAFDSLGMSRNYAPEKFTNLGVQAKLNHHFYAELITPREGGPTFQEVFEHSVPASLLDLPVRVPTKEMLIMLKEHAIASNSGDSKKHAQDIRLLKRHVI